MDIRRFMEEEGRGRVGRTHPNSEAPQGIQQRSMQEVRQTPCGHAQALAEFRPGVLTAWRGRGRGISPPSPSWTVERGRGLSLTATTSPTMSPRPSRTRRGRVLSLQILTTPPHPVRQGRGFPSSSPPHTPPPLWKMVPSLGGTRRLLSDVHVTTPFASNPMTFFHPTSLYLVQSPGPTPL